MASLAYELKGSPMASATDTRKILDALAAMERRQQESMSALGIAVAELKVKATGTEAQITTLETQVQLIRDGKATRPELAATEARFEKELSRMEKAVGDDVAGFQGMYDSLIAEMKTMKEENGKKLDTISASVNGLNEKVQKLEPLSERVSKLEPLRDEWLKWLGARWVIGVLSAFLSSIATLGLSKWFGGGK